MAAWCPASRLAAAAASVSLHHPFTVVGAHGGGVVSCKHYNISTTNHARSWQRNHPSTPAGPAAALNLATTKGPPTETTTATLAISAAGPAFRGTISAARRGELNGKREREREREGKRKSALLLERLACCYFWLRWYLAGRPSVIRRCKTRKATFSVLCEAALLSHSQRTDGRSENAVLQALSLRLRVRASERSAHATTIDSDSD